MLHFLFPKWKSQPVRNCVDLKQNKKGSFGSSYYYDVYFPLCLHVVQYHRLQEMINLIQRVYRRQDKKKQQHIFTPLNEICNYYPPKGFLSPHKSMKNILQFSISAFHYLFQQGCLQENLEKNFFSLYLRILAIDTILPNPHFAYEKIDSRLTFFFFFSFIMYMCVFVTKIRLFISSTMKRF